MQVRIGLTNGDIMVSDYNSDAEILDWLHERNGLIGQDEFSQVRVEDLDDAIAFMTRLMSSVIGEPDGKVSLTINGDTVSCPGDEVAWLRIARD